MDIDYKNKYLKYKKKYLNLKILKGKGDNSRKIKEKSNIISKNYGEKMPDGYGIYLYKNGKKMIEGNWKNNKFYGIVDAYNEEGNIRYHGDTENGKFNGNGEIYFNNILRVKGQFKNNYINGLCHFYRECKGDGINMMCMNVNDKYIKTGLIGNKFFEGNVIVKNNFLNNEVSIYQNGTFYHTDGKKVYTGELKNGNMHGKGKMLLPKGYVYDGEWKSTKGRKGKKHGKGIIYTDKGKIHKDGKWKDGKFIKGKVIHFTGGYSIRGLFTFHDYDESVYDGEYNNLGERHGKGIEFFTDKKIKKKFEGEWENNYPLKGMYYFKNGKKRYHVVSWDNSQFDKLKINNNIILFENLNFNGTIYTPNSKEFFIKNGKIPDGEFNIYNSDGNEVIKQIWKNGNKIKEVYVSEKDLQESIENKKSFSVKKLSGKCIYDIKQYNIDSIILEHKSCDYFSSSKLYDFVILNGKVYFKKKYKDQKDLDLKYEGKIKVTRNLSGKYYLNKYGYGIEYWPNGNKKYEGNWIDGWVDDEVVKGLYRGKGIEYFENGKKKYEGIFKNGKFISGISYDNSSENKIKTIVEKKSDIIDNGFLFEFENWFYIDEILKPIIFLENISSNLKKN